MNKNKNQPFSDSIKSTLLYKKKKIVNPAYGDKKLFLTLYGVVIAVKTQTLSFIGTAERGCHAGMSRSCGLPLPYYCFI